jgi:hypothetical protein
MFARFTQAIVCPPAHAFADGLTSVDLGVPDVQQALAQHAAYCISRSGVRVISPITIRLWHLREHPSTQFVITTRRRSRRLSFPDAGNER